MSAKISSEFISSVDALKEPKKKKAKTSKSSDAFKKIVSKNPASAAAAPMPKAKKYPFKPTKGEAWTKTTVEIDSIAAGIFNWTALPLIKLKLNTDGGKKIFDSVDVQKFKKVGQIEEFALKVMKLEMTTSYERSEEIHNKLKIVLKDFAEKGMTGALSSIVSLITNP